VISTLSRLPALSISTSFAVSPADGLSVIFSLLSVFHLSQVNLPPSTLKPTSVLNDEMNRRQSMRAVTAGSPGVQ